MLLISSSDVKCIYIQNLFYVLLVLDLPRHVTFDSSNSLRDGPSGPVVVSNLFKLLIWPSS